MRIHAKKSICGQFRHSILLRHHLKEKVSTFGIHSLKSLEIVMARMMVESVLVSTRAYNIFIGKVRVEKVVTEERVVVRSREKCRTRMLYLGQVDKVNMAASPAAAKHDDVYGQVKGVQPETMAVIALDCITHTHVHVHVRTLCMYDRRA